jgi:hypothetical protein
MPSLPLKDKEWYCVEISNRFAALENLDIELDVNKSWETIRENIKMSAKESLGYYELMKIKPWLKIIRPKEPSQIAVVTGSKRNRSG